MSGILDVSRLFRRDRQGRRGRGVALYGTEGLEYMELTVGGGTVESLWITIKWRTNNVDVIMGVSYRPTARMMMLTSKSLRN